MFCRSEFVLYRVLTIPLLVALADSRLPAQQVSGKLRQWHQVILTFDGPVTSEDANPNPFFNHRLDVTFRFGNVRRRCQSSKCARSHTGSAHRGWYLQFGWLTG